jgi:arylsulfatase A-like enzyme
MPSERPNILFFHIDNLGMGELGCYGGGILRGADTKRADKFATEGIKLTHYVVEPQCTPTRSALMTGRLPIRSGNHTIALGGNAGEDHRRNSVHDRIRVVLSREVAYRCGRRPLANRSRF